jgi:hypothetical protein
MSDDGLSRTLYTNMKALYHGILNLGGYTPLSVTMVEETSPIYTFTDLKFTYANLCKVLVHSSAKGKRYQSAGILCENESYLNIEEHAIVSK